MNSLVQVSNLSKIFFLKHHSLQAVKNFSLEIKSGEILGLAGESGCGKSTIGKLLLRLIQPTTGFILFNDQNIEHLSSKALKQFRREAQMIFQNPAASLNPRMTIENILQEPLDIHRLSLGSERKKRLNELLTLVGLDSNYLGRLPQQLSGGQKQRISIARALAVQPRFLICDEPLSALDVSIQAQIINLLKNLQIELSLTYLFISHDLSVMRYLTNRIAIMYLGEIIELAPNPLLYQNPLHPYTQALLSSIPIPHPQKERTRSRLILKGEIPSPIHPPNGCRFHTRCPFVQPLCKSVAPKWKEITPGHFTACHLYETKS